ncbi:MAG: hypothetical protein K8T90_13795 [Planctomycetes bacterium]|nr:hypothetical protein [Planctomycetota bacterium]
MRPLTLAATVALLVAASGAPKAVADDGKSTQPPEAINRALALQGLTRDDVGWEARGTWEGYPCDIPYKLRHFDDLLAEPFATVPWVRAMGASVRDTLDPAKLEDKGVRGAGGLMRAAHALGINRRFGALRSYSANLTAKPTPLDEALLACWRAAGRPTRFVTFGQESPYPEIEKPLTDAAKTLPKEIGDIVGQLVVNLIDARRWADLTWRNVPLEKRVAVSKRLDLGAEEVDALDYEPAVDDVARTWDEASLWYASMKTVEALDVARQALAPLIRPRAMALADVQIDVETPLGRVVITGTGEGTTDLGDAGAFLVVDLGGDDHYRGRVGASDATRSVGACLEMGGDDLYTGGDVTQGAGVCGVGVLLDAAGNDVVKSTGALAQGAGQFGFGALIDIAGNDKRTARYSAQGAAYFGVGLLFDIAGDDEYVVASDGQGFGGAAGVGVLADRSGSDRYEAIRDPAASGRPSYHQLTPETPRVSVSNAQGCSMGRRGDGADGHSWAGGLGALLDGEGDDTYSAANWAQGTGYWFGTGVLWDGAGNDTYAADWWCSASGAHFCIGALVDEAGDDVHTCRATNGIAFGHDFTLAVLADLAGNDRYECPNDVIARSINRSVAMLLDGGGDDVYRSGEKRDARPANGAVAATPAVAAGRPGSATFDAKMLDRRATGVYWTEPTSVGLFVDAGGGKDDYGPDADAVTRDGGSWIDGDDSDNAHARNFGIGIDTEAPMDVDRPQGGKR